MQKSRLAQRKLGIKPTNNKPQKRNLFTPLLVVFILILAFGILFFILSPKSWDGKEKFSVVSDGVDNISIQVLDPANSGVLEIDIPSSTEVEASNQLGTWKLGSITKLGIDKNLSSDFLKNTIIKSFNFPIDSSSNLSLLDKLRIKFYLLTIGNNSKVTVNLKDTNYLNRQQLVDGTLGYKISDSMPTKVESYFTEDFLDTNQNVLINNYSGSIRVGSMTGKVLEVLGTNIASIENLDAKNFDCKIVGTETDLVQKIAKILGCNFSLSRPANNFDIEVDLGTAFKNRF